MGKFNLTDAAKAVISEDAKSTFEANIKSKMAQRGGDKAPHGEVGQDKLKSTIAYGTQDAGDIGRSPETEDEHNPDYTKGTPTATPPGATPPVGSEKDGVGYSKPQGQPQETMGRKDLLDVMQYSANEYDQIRDRAASKLAKQTMQSNPGATFQSYSEDIEAMLSGETLSEEFKQKAATIFEAAVNARVQEQLAITEEQLVEDANEAIEEYKQELTEKIDDYLNYMVQEWVKENELAITEGLKSQIVEDFILGLKGLFEEHYIDIPEDKVDVVEEMVNEIEELKNSLNEQINSAIELQKELNEHRKIEAVHAVCEGLTITQVEKIKALAEGVEYTSHEDFVAKLETIKESYFNGSSVKSVEVSNLNEEVIIEDLTEIKKNVDSEMKAYMQTISKTLKK